MINKITFVICTIILSIGFLGAGYSIGKGFYLVKKMSRSVTVKGLAEKDVKSDLGIWEINYREVGNDLVQLDQRLQHDQDVVIAFLKKQGFTDDEIGHTQLKVEDRLANIYSQPGTQTTNDQRYVVTAGVRVRSINVDLIQKTVQIANQLLQQGVPLTFDASLLSPNPSFYYTQLDSIRPAMLAEATKSARTVAEQFAKDSDSKLAGIQRASQGVFQIMGRDTSTMSADWNSNQNALGSIDKKVRLVTTIDYRLR
ncbi:SIMPL domain-containing protein [Aquicella lusitana]|uniref:SIMPL domain-containing protein n=1 Tax=Aquicella lusitana TaxID=254246 RepID=A0A370GMY4_9COXI|nr:SIMPL domain-containing protein [Aquicella lusitana]RDI43784.1 hypothetical protein C8D86_11054 [Aquicella lusitana]VVC74485.1 hypothetical protein AQULUS_22510 [Aquicella lusitana]